MTWAANALSCDATGAVGGLNPPTACFASSDEHPWNRERLG